MKVLLLGSTGYVGGAVLDRLLEHGHQVMAIVRPHGGTHGPVAEAEGLRLVVGDVSEPGGLARVISEERVGAVIHAAAVGDWDVDRRLVETLASALAAGGSDAARPVLIYTSGVWVLGPTASDPAVETTRTNPIPIVAGREAVEAAVLGQRSVRGIVIRPGIVHGRRGGIPEMLVQWAGEDGAGRFVAESGQGPVSWPMVHVDDLADLYVRALESPEATGVLHGVAEPSVPVSRLAAAAAEAAGVLGDARPWAFSQAVEQLGPDFAEALVLDQRVEATAARAIGWKPSRAGAEEELRSRTTPSPAGHPRLAMTPESSAPRGQKAPTGRPTPVRTAS